MKRAIDIVFLKKEAYLFDSKLYILKSFVAVLTAYAIGHRLPIIHKDMISILFGLMMTLEPVTVTGIRSGRKQIQATILGALATTLIISMFGINTLTIALSISATLLLCLKINWREVSAVAIFTSIYMTQYVQYTANGEPSVLLTFLLRILALGFGVLIAVIYNFLFSLFFYKRMETKRIAHLFLAISAHMQYINHGLESNQVSTFYQEKEMLSDTFGGIEWLMSLLKDLEREEKWRKIASPSAKYQEIVKYKNVLLCLRNTAHLIYDMLYQLTNGAIVLNMEDRTLISATLEEFVRECNQLSDYYESNQIQMLGKPMPSLKGTISDKRIMNDLEEVIDILNEVKELQKKSTKN